MEIDKILDDLEKEEKFEREKRSFVVKFLGFFNRKKYNEYKSIEEVENKSIFDEYVSEVSKKEESYENVRLAATLCEEALRIAKQRLVLVNRTKATVEKIEEIKYFEALEIEDVEYFKIILNRYVGLVKERNVLRHQITSFDHAIGDLMKLEEDAKLALSKMDDAEKTQRIFRQDLNHLEGEKLELEDEDYILNSGKEFFRKFTYFLVFSFVAGAVGLCFANASFGVDIFLPLVIMILSIMFLTTFVVLFRQKLNRDIKYNNLLRNKAIGLLNRKNVVYARYTNFLKFTYKKYRVNSSKELAANLRELEHYKHLTGRIDSVRRVVHESEIEINEFLKEHHIPNNKISLLNFAETINVENQKRYFDSLVKEHGIVEDSLQDLDKKHEICWEKLIELKEEDKTQNHIISEIVRAYYDEIDGLVEEFEKDSHRV